MDDKPKISALAVASFIIPIALFFLPLVSGLAAVVVGVIAICSIAKYKGILSGKGFAVTGIVIGLLQIVFITAFSLLINIILAFSLSHVSYSPRASDFGIAERYAKQGDYTDAITFYKRALSQIEKAEDFRVHANEFVIYNNLGLAYQVIGEFDNALTAYNSALRVANKEMGLAYYGIAAVNKDKGNYEQLLELLDKAIECNPSLVVAYQEKASILRYSGRYEDSVTACKRTIKLFPDFAQAHSTLGLAYEKLDKYDEAVKEHIEAIRLNPQRYYPRGRLAYCFSRINNKNLREELLATLSEVDFELSEEIRFQLNSGVKIKENSFDDLNKDLRKPL
jgi:tetratricopeptide (TPR) repeat protein